MRGVRFPHAPRRLRCFTPCLLQDSPDCRSRDAARAAADGARDAAQAAEDARRAASVPSPDLGLARRAADRARDAAELAYEAAEEAADRPAWVPSAHSGASSGVLTQFRQSVQSHQAFLRGKALLQARKYQEAREQLSEATILDADHDEARTLLAWSEYFVGDFRGASINFKTALRRQPKWEGLEDGLGWSRFRLGRFHLALAAFRSALGRNSNYVDALNGQGSALFELGRYDEALPPLERALEGLTPLIGHEPPETLAVRAKVAWSLYHVGRYRDALAMFARAVRADPGSHQLQGGIGWCYLKLSRPEDARAAFQRALQLSPGDQDALQGLRLTSR